VKEFVFVWQGLIAGALGLLAGIIAFAGALIAAQWQVAGMRRAADQEVAEVRRAADLQVDAVRAQIDDAQAVRGRAERRRRRIIEWAVRVEGRRLRAAVDARRDRALPSKPRFAARRVEQLVIKSGALLRGEREDMALLDSETRTRLEEISSVLDEYNARIETAPLGKEDNPQIFQETLDSIARLDELAAALQTVAAR
jgi:hypothetical protein